MAKEIAAGSKAPEFCLQDSSGKKVCLKDFRGKWAVVYFYPADDTPGCTTEACDFTASLKEFEKLSAIVLGISPDSQESHRKFTEKYKLKVKLLSDEKHEVLKKYGAWQLKSMYGKEYYGVVRSTFLINPEGKVAFAWPKVKAEGHAKEVKNKLEELK